MEERIVYKGSQKGEFCLEQHGAKILARDSLMRRGITMVNRCCMYKCSDETVDHLLIHYIVAKELWSFVFSMFGFHWVLPEQVVDVLSGQKFRVVTHDNFFAWKIVPLYLIWVIWRKMNNRTFNDVKLSVME
jgi:hypothetical protein